jgi:hypothetical protein
MRKVGVCYYFGLSVLGFKPDSLLRSTGMRRVPKDLLTLFDCACSNCRLCETKRNFVF